MGKDFRSTVANLKIAIEQYFAPEETDEQVDDSTYLAALEKLSRHRKKFTAEKSISAQ